MIVLLTGGASGLGEVLTCRLAEEGHEVWFTWRSAEDRARALEQKYPNAHGIRCDFSNPDDVTALTERMTEIQADVLINNAWGGSFIDAHFHKTDLQQFRDGFEHNLLPAIAVTQSAIQLFRKKKFGKIITILTAALVGNPPMGTAAYVAGKAYLKQLAMLWATENARFNITSNCISPAFMETRFTADIDERLVDQMRDNHPLKALLKPEEVAHAVSFLIAASQQINGNDLVINAASSIR